MKEFPKQLVKNSGVVATDLQNELLLFDPVSSSAFVLNESGKMIWKGLENGSRPEQLIEAAERSAGEADRDSMNKFFVELEKAGLVNSAPVEERVSTNPEAVFPQDFEFTPPTVNTYSEEFLRDHLKDSAFVSFHDDTYSGLQTEEER